MPYIKTTLTDREIHLITSALQNIMPRTGQGRANATLSTQVSREYTGLQALLERFVSDLTDEDPLTTPPARVKPFASGQPLFQFNVYNNYSAPCHSPRAVREGLFAPVPVSSHSYVRVEEHGELIISPDQIHQTRGDHRLIGSASDIDRALLEECEDEACDCQGGYSCPNASNAFFAANTPKAYTAYLPATSPVLEYINTHRRRRCRDEMLADMSGSLLPLLSRDEIREALNINRTELRYAEAPGLLVAHKIMALASIANTAPAEYLTTANIVATIDVLL